MPGKPTLKTLKQLLGENADLRARLDEAEETLRAIRSGEVDALVVPGAGGEQIFTLKGANRPYRVLIEDMSEGALTLTADGVILYANRRFAEMLKTPLEKVIGSTIHTWIAPDRQRILQALLQKGADEKRREELALTASDGTQVPVYLSVNRLLPTDETPASFCLVATDLTEQKRIGAIVAAEKLAQELLAAANQSRLALLSVIEDRTRAEEALRESETRYRLISMVTSDYMFSTRLAADGKLALNWVAGAFERITGYTFEEYVAHGGWRAALHPDDLTVDDRDMEKLCANQPVITEVRTLTKSGKTVWVRVYAHPVWDAERKELVGIHGAVQDITERKQAEEALRDKVITLQALAEIDREVIAATQSQGVLDLVCRRAAELLRVPKSGVTIEAPSGDVNMVASYGLLDVARAQEEFTRKWRGGIMRGNRLRERGAFGVDDIPPDAPYMPEFCAREGVRAFAIAPMMADERTLGALVVLDTSPRVWSVDELQVLSLLAGQAAIALDRARQFEETRARAEQLALLYDAGLALNRELDPHTQLQALFKIAMKALHADRAEFFRYDAARNELRFELGIGYPDAAQDALRSLAFDLGDERGVVSQVGQKRTPLYVPDVSALPNWVTVDPEIRSGLWAPVEHEAQLLGVLAVLSTHADAFTLQDKQLLVLFANQAAVALENARLFEAEHAGRQRLEMLYRIGQAINSTLDAGAILDRLTDEAMRTTHATHGSALVALPDLGHFERRSLRGYSPELAERARATRLPLNHGVNGRAYHTRQIVCVDDVQADPNYFPLVPDTRAELAMPIMRGGQVLGNLDLQSPEIGAFRDVDLGLLQALTDQVAIALENARLFGETRRRLDELAIVAYVALVGAAGRPFDETVARATDSLIELWLDVNVSFLFVDEADQSLRLHPSAHGVSPEIIASLRIPLNQGITGWVVRERLPVRVGDVTADPRYAVAVGMPGAGSEMAAPLVTGDRVIGVVNVESPRLNAFSGDDLRLLTTLAGQLATIFEKARLDAALEKERGSLARRVEERTAELNIANAELRQAARAKDEFLASMSHELRTPLSAILGISEALQEQVFGPLNEKQLRYLHTIEESGQHLLALINDILDLSKVEAGKVELQISRVVVEPVCQASLQFIKEAAHKKHLKVSLILDSRVSTMQADERRLKQILVNLLSNAVKFTSEGGEIGLQVLGDVEQQIVHFVVWDTGIGISQENIGRLFQPFVQLDSSLSRQYTGTGLGLALVRRLAELHGGSVSVESEVGKGSRFTVSLPWRVARDEKRVASDEERVGKDGALDARHSASVAVLLAEDSETNLTAMSDYLSAKGCRVIVARNGSEAIRRAREDRPDVILMDIQMPGMDGLEAIRHIRAEPDPRVAQVPIIALTAIAMSGDRQRCMEAGANEYLSKPVSLKELVEVIEAQLREA